MRTIIGLIFVIMFTAIMVNAQALPLPTLNPPVVSGSSVELSWTPVEGASGYNVYRLLSADGTHMLESKTDLTKYTVTGLACGTTFSFFVTAYNGNGEGWGYSNAISVTMGLCSPVLTYTATQTSITLSWDQISGATGYKVYRLINSFGTHMELGATTETSFEVESLACGTTFSFFVTSYNDDGERWGYDNAISASTISCSVTGVENDKASKEFSLEQNYPNPFNPSTTIHFVLPEQSFLSLNVYNLLGEKVATLANEILPAGQHSVDFDGSNLPSGIYVYRLISDKFSASKKMLLTK